MSSFLGSDGSSAAPISPSGNVLPPKSPAVAFYSAEPCTDYTALEYPPQSGHVGLQNLGNTCYLNASIQALAAVAPFARFFCETPRDEEEPDADSATKLSSSLRVTMLRLLDDEARRSNLFFSPRDLRNALSRVNPQFEGWGQQDAHEALRALLDTANEQLATPFPVGLYSNDFGSGRVRLRRDESSTNGAASMQVDDDERESSLSSGAASFPSGNRAQSLSRDGNMQLPPERGWLRYGPHSGSDCVLRSIVSDAFEFVVRSHVRCRACKGDSFTYSPYHDLSVEVPNKPHAVAAGSDGSSHPPAAAAWAASAPSTGGNENHSPASTPRDFFSNMWRLVGWSDENDSVGLGDALYTFFDWERIEYTCDLCKTKGEAAKRYSIVELPEVLCIHLKRFKHSMPTGLFVGRNAEAVAQKLATPVAFPTRGPLDMSPFVSDGALDHARKSFERAKALQVGEMSPREGPDPSFGFPEGGSGRVVADVSVESQGILLHRASLLTGRTGVEDASAKASAAAIETASHSGGGASSRGGGGGDGGGPVTPPRYPQSFQQAFMSRGKADASSIVTGPVPISQPRTDPDRPSNALYELTSVIQHLGSMGGGHYVTHTRDPAPNASPGSWLTFDDDRVISTSADEVESQQGYIFFFTRRKPTPSSKHAQITLPSSRMLSHSGARSMEVDGSSPVADSGLVFVSRYWWHRYRSFSYPGPITNADILCDHGSLKKKFAGKRKGHVTVALTVAEYSILARSYGASEPPLRSLDECDTCKREAQLLQRRRTKENVEVDRVDSNCLPQIDDNSNDADTFWYIVSEAWLKQWRAFIENTTKDDGTGRGVLPPGPIDNARLLGKGGAPLPNLKPLIHFRGVNWKVWTFLRERYGGGPELRRRKICL